MKLSPKKSFSQLFSGLSRSLIISFLLLSLLPLISISALNYKNTRSSIQEIEVNALSTALQLKLQYLKNFFEERVNDLLIQSDLQGNIILLGKLNSAFKRSGLPIKRFVKSYNYVSIVSASTADLTNYQSVNGYHDILLLDLQGNIMFSVTGEDDLGTNILSGPYSNTNLSEAASRALKIGRPQCSDLGFYEPSGNREAIFFAQVMVDEEGEPQGLMAFQIFLDEINNIMQDNTGMGETGQTFLVGKDLMLRSALRNTDNSGMTLYADGVLQKEVDIPLTRDWFAWDEEQHTKTQDNEETTVNQLINKTYSYIGQSGSPAIGVGRYIEALEKLGLHWLMIAEIDEAETFAPVRELVKLAIIALTITGFLVFVFAVLLSNKITRPIIALTGWAKRVALGDLSMMKVATPNNEIGEMAQSLTSVVNSFKDTAHKARSIALGDYRFQISLRSEQDELGLALQKMTTTLQDVVKQTNIIALGDYSADIAPLGKKDELGVALQKMTRSLRDVSEKNMLNDWLKTGQAELAEQIRGDKDIISLSTDIITFLAKYLKFQVGTFFVIKGDESLTLKGSYSLARGSNQIVEVKFGEGLVGQAAHEKQYTLLSDVPKDYLDVTSSLGHARCRQILIMPVLMADQVMGGHGVWFFAKYFYYKHSVFRIGC